MSLCSVGVNALLGAGNLFKFPRGFTACRWQSGGGGAPWSGGAGSAERPHGLVLDSLSGIRFLLSSFI